jgi:hypothetical protein
MDGAGDRPEAGNGLKAAHDGLLVGFRVNKPSSVNSGKKSYLVFKDFGGACSMGSG